MRDFEPPRGDALPGRGGCLPGCLNSYLPALISACVRPDCGTGGCKASRITLVSKLRTISNSRRHPGWPGYRPRDGWIRLHAVVGGCQDRGRDNKPEYCRCTHSIPGILLGPPVYVGYFPARYLYVCHRVLYGGLGISGLLGEKDPLIVGVVAPRLRWPAQQRCVRRCHVAGVGVRHTVALSAGATCFARYACR